MVESAFVKDVTFNPSRNKGGAGLGGWGYKKEFFVHHVTPLPTGKLC